MFNSQSLKNFINHPAFKVGLCILFAGILLGLCTHAFAEDVLTGTTSDATTTLSGSGKKWLYLIEGVSALGAYIKSKNVFVLGGVVVVALMVNIILHLAGNN